MDTLFLIIAFVLALAGIAGSFLPVLPGPPLSWLALLLLYFTDQPATDMRMLVLHGVVAGAITLLDYYVPIWGTKKFGGSPAGVRGSTIGLLVGLFFAPLGILLGPFVGAYLGETLGGRKQNDALRSAMGSFLGFLAGTLLKLVYGIFVLWLLISSFW